MQAVQELEYRVWKMDPIPTHQTMTAIKNGGIMLGLFDGDLLVGLRYGFAGFNAGKSYLCYHLMWLVASYRSQGLVDQIYQQQREIVLLNGSYLLMMTIDNI